jgi:hypothetical protein
MLDKNEESKFRAFKQMARELKVPCPPEIFIGLQVFDKDDNLIFDDLQRGHSWNRNFYNRIFHHAAANLGDGSGLFQAGNMSAKQVSGTIYSNSSSGYCYNGSTTWDWVIRVGTSDTAFSAEQYGLGGLIADGTGSGQLSHQANVRGSLTYNSKVWLQGWSRIFNNNSGAPITVREVGLATQAFNYPYHNVSVTSEIYNERSLLSPSVTVPDGGRLKVEYLIQMDFSAID